MPEEGETGGGIRLGNRRGKKDSKKGGVDRSNLHKKVITTGKPLTTGVSIE